MISKQVKSCADKSQEISKTVFIKSIAITVQDDIYDLTWEGIKNVTIDNITISTFQNQGNLSKILTIILFIIWNVI